MADKEVKLITVEGKHYVDVEESVKHIKQELKGNHTILVKARGIEISRVALVVRRVEEEANCVIAKMETKNVKEKDHQGHEVKILEFHVKLIKKG